MWREAREIIRHDDRAYRAPSQTRWSLKPSSMRDREASHRPLQRAPVFRAKPLGGHRIALADALTVLP